jgi:hypothetical protein
MVPDKVHQNNYSSNSKNSKKESIKSRSIKQATNRQPTNNGNKFSYANARSSLGLINQSMQFDDFANEPFTDIH